MYAEQILGLADCHALRRTHNTKVGFIDGKVKCNKNNILLFIYRMKLIGPNFLTFLF